MTASREDVITTLFTRLCGTGLFTSSTRRNRAPENFSPELTPALVLVEHSDDYVRPSKSAPPIRSLILKAIVYFDAGNDPNIIPSTSINVVLDAFDSLLTPDDLQRGTCTLGGVCDAVLIDGTIERAPGDITGKSIAVVPIRVLLP